MTKRMGMALAAALILALSTLWSAEAGAHAVLLSTEPAADSVVERAPGAVVLRFNEPVRPVVARVIDVAGERATADGDARAVDTRVEIPFPGTWSRGSYVVTWRVISTDGHPVGGAFRFSLGEEPAEGWVGPVETGDGALSWWRAVAVVNRTLFLFCMLAAAGGVWFRAALAPASLAGPLRVRTAVLATVALAASVLLVPIQGRLVLGPGPEGPLDPLLWVAGIDTPLGVSAVVGGLGTALVLAGSLVGGVFAAVVASLGGAVAAASLALTGHAATAEPRWLTGPALAAHGLCAAFWLGALWPLLLVVRRESPAVAARVLGRFSLSAVAAVVVLVAAGTVLATVQVERISALVLTDFGRALLLKLALVALVLLLAVQNKARFTAGVGRGDAAAARGLGRNIRLELAGMAAILLVTASLGHMVPPRALAVPPDREAIREIHHHDSHGPLHDRHDHHHGVHHHGHDDGAGITALATSGGREARIALRPGRPGHNVLTVEFLDRNGKPVEVLDVNVRLAQPDLGIEPLVRPMADGPGGSFELSGSDFVVSGRWSVRVDALISDFEKAIFEAELTVP